MKTEAINLINKIKQLFADMPIPAAPVESNEPTNSVVMNTTDGVEVVVDKLATGGKATIAGQPAAAGTYVFTDGSSIVVDTTGTITTYTAPAVPATPPPTIPDPTLDAKQNAPAQVTQPNPAKMSKQFKFSDIKKTEEIETMFAAFATGTPEERISNLELVCKALMEYNFGWEIRQAKENTDKQAAISIYTNELSTVQAQMKSQKETIEKQQGIIVQMFALMEEFSKEPVANPPGETKKSFKFNEVLGKKKGNSSINKYAEAAQKIKEEQEAASK
jgi:hypothetical protein